MIGKCFAVFCTVSVVFSIFTGNLSALSDAIFDGASKSVSLSISLLGVMCLWGGVMSLLKSAGMIEKLSHLLRPILKFAFPTAFKTGIGAEEITANVSANLFGIGNAATPLAISAMKKMQENNPSADTASDDMITLAVLNSSSLDLFPMTLIALRRAAGATDPYSIIMPIWITSLLSSILAIVLCRIFAARKRNKQRSTA